MKTDALDALAFVLHLSRTGKFNIVPPHAKTHRTFEGLESFISDDVIDGEWHPTPSKPLQISEKESESNE